VCGTAGRVYQSKADVEYSCNGTEVDYHLGKHVEFVPHLSHGLENDTVNVPNIPVAVRSAFTFLTYIGVAFSSLTLLIYN